MRREILSASYYLVNYLGSRVKCGCTDADVIHVKCGEISRRLSVDVMLRLGLDLWSALGVGSGSGLAKQSACIALSIAIRGM